MPGRIQLETLGLALTIPCLQEEDFAELDAALSAMRSATTMEEWEVPHRRFHQILVSQAGEQIRNTMASYADQSQRYRLILAYREIHAQSVSAIGARTYSPGMLGTQSRGGRTVVCASSGQNGLDCPGSHGS